MKQYIVLAQNWTESERGWGMRPDGYSIHLTKEDVKKYIDAYWKRMPAAVPDEYSFPDGEPVAVVVSKKLYEKVKNQRPGFHYGRQLPGKTLDDLVD